MLFIIDYCPATLDLQGYRRSQQGGGSQARSFKDQITGLFRPGPTSENQQPSSDSSKPQSNFLELPVKDHRSVMISWWQCQWFSLVHIPSEDGKESVEDLAVFSESQL